MFSNTPTATHSFGINKGFWITWNILTVTSSAFLAFSFRFFIVSEHHAQMTTRVRWTELSARALTPAQILKLFLFSALRYQEYKGKEILEGVKEMRRRDLLARQISRFLVLKTQSIWWKITESASLWPHFWNIFLVNPKSEYPSILHITPSAQFLKEAVTISSVVWIFPRAKLSKRLFILYLFISFGIRGCRSPKKRALCVLYGYKLD